MASYLQALSGMLFGLSSDRHFMELIKWSVADMRYINFYFGVIKQSIFVFFLMLVLVSCCFFLWRSGNTDTLPHGSWAQLALCYVNTYFTVIFLHLTYRRTHRCTFKYVINYKLFSSVPYTLRRISVNAVVTTCIFRELMRLSNAVVTPVF